LSNGNLTILPATRASQFKNSKRKEFYEKEKTRAQIWANDELCSRETSIALLQWIPAKAHANNNSQLVESPAG
jgi:hypothetical protein